MRAIALMIIGLLLPCFGGGLTFVDELKEVQMKPEERTLAVDFDFENKTDKPVTISKYDATCSCMKVQVKGGKLTYEPGEKGVIRGVFDMGNFSGTVDKALMVWLKGDGAVKPSIVLNVRVHIPVLVEVEPKTLRWDIGEEAVSRVLVITMNHSEPITVKSATCSNDNFQIELTAVEEGKKYQLKVTPKSTATQGIGVVNIMTDCSVSRQASQRAFTVIRKPTPEPGK